MLQVTLYEKDSIAILEPKEALTEEDFLQVRKTIDSFIEKGGALNGIIIYLKTFPWWDSFKAFVKHLKFIKDHHKKVSHVAFVTDSIVGEFAEHIGSHFVSAEVKNFSFDELEDANRWIKGSNEKA